MASSAASSSSANPPEPLSVNSAILTYLRLSSPSLIKYEPSAKEPQAKGASTTRFEWKNIRQIADWDRFNHRDFPASCKHRALLQAAHSTPAFPPIKIPWKYRIIVDEKHVETFLFMSVLAKVNTVLEHPSMRSSPSWKLLSDVGVISGWSISNPTVTPQGSGKTSRGCADHHGICCTQATTNKSKPVPLTVGEVKRTAVWSLDMRLTQTIQHRTVLAQLDLYMRNADVKYGWIMTEKEFVAVYRPGPKGLLKLSRSYPIFFEAHKHPSTQLCAEEALVDLLLWASIKDEDPTELSAMVVDDPEYIAADSGTYSTLTNADEEDSSSDDHAKGSKGKQNYVPPDRRRSNEQVTPTQTASRPKRNK